MRVLVTGGAGWTAAAIVAELAQAGHRPVLFDRVPPAGPPARCETRIGDVSDYASVEAALAGTQAAVHLAVATGDGAYNEPRLPFATNVRGTYNLFEAAHRAGVHRLVLMSGAPVHLEPGAADGAWRSHPGDDHLYDLTKRLQEEIARDFCAARGMTAVALRAGHIVDGRAGLDPKGRALETLDYCKGGWVCRYDLARACRLALEADLRGFVALPVVGALPGYGRFGVAETERVLGFRLESDFAGF